MALTILAKTFVMSVGSMSNYAKPQNLRAKPSFYRGQSSDLEHFPIMFKINKLASKLTVE